MLKLVIISFFVSILIFSLGHFLFWWSPHCQNELPGTCSPGFVCAKAFSEQPKCLKEPAVFPEVLSFPFEQGTKIVCTQPPRNAKGTHSWRLTLYAIDLANPYDKEAAPIFAGTDGVVDQYDRCPQPAGTPAQTSIDHCGRGFGNYVRLFTKSNYSVLYAHLAKVFVHQGEVVTKGQLLGLEGATGLAGQRHLHWQVNYLGWKHLLPRFLDALTWSTPSVPFIFEAVQEGRDNHLFRVDQVPCQSKDSSAE